jgi:Tfp pilus assembly protein PilO
MKKNNTNQRTNWLFGLAVAGAILAYVFLVFLPGQRATAELRKELETKRGYVVASGYAGVKMAQSEKELARINEFTKTWRESAPTESRIAQLFVKITKAAEGAKVEIIRFEPQPAERLEMLDRIPVEMACEGTFVQAFDFLTRLESLEADFWVTGLHIERVNAESPRLRCELSLAFFADRPKISD